MVNNELLLEYYLGQQSLSCCAQPSGYVNNGSFSNVMGFRAHCKNKSRVVAVPKTENSNVINFI